jgi:hypothetical protein
MRMLLPEDDARKLSTEGVEVWTACPAFEDYSVSNMGRVYSSLKSKFLSPFNNGNGYLAVALFDRSKKKKTLLVHRLVLLAFDGPSPDGSNDGRHVLTPDKGDERLCNLAWGTRSENMMDVWRHRSEGFKARTTSARESTENPTYTLDQHLVEIGLEFSAEGKLNIADLSRLWNVSRVVATGIINGHTWKHAARPEDNSMRIKREGATHHLSHINEEMLAAAFLQAGQYKWTAAQFAEHLGITTHTARQIWSGRTWKTVSRPAEFIEHMNALSRAFSKMSDVTVIEILQMAKDNKWGAPRLARHFGKSTCTISNLLAGNTYTHIPR